MTHGAPSSARATARRVWAAPSRRGRWTGCPPLPPAPGRVHGHRCPRTTTRCPAGEYPNPCFVVHPPVTFYTLISQPKPCDRRVEPRRTVRLPLLYVIPQRLFVPWLPCVSQSAVASAVAALFTPSVAAHWYPGSRGEPRRPVKFPCRGDETRRQRRRTDICVHVLHAKCGASIFIYFSFPRLGPVD